MPPETTFGAVRVACHLYPPAEAAAAALVAGVGDLAMEAEVVAEAEADRGTGAEAAP